MQKASTGAISAGISSFETTASPETAPVPAAAIEAPITPPLRACDELDGSAKYHVGRFQTRAREEVAGNAKSRLASFKRIAPIRPPKSPLDRIPDGSTKAAAPGAAAV